MRFVGLEEEPWNKPSALIHAIRFMMTELLSYDYQ